MNQGLPIVSIVIPCLEEKEFIGKCLDSIIANDYPRECLEVLVVDGMSSDGTRTMVEGYVQQYPFVRLLDNPRLITPVALNIGIRNAKGSVVIRMDAHAEYPLSFISSAVACLQKTDTDVVGGPVITRPRGDSLMARSIALVTSHPFGVGNSKFRTSRKEGYVDTVPFGAYRRDIFEKVGYFDERLVRNQDNELSSRIIRSGGRIYFTPKLTAHYYNQGTLKGLLKQAFKTGKWNVVTLKVNPYAFRLRHFVPLFFVCILLFLIGLSFLSRFALYSLTGLLLIYFFTAIGVSIHGASRNGLRFAMVLPFVFPAYHFSYGLGSLTGLFTTNVRRLDVNLEKCKVEKVEPVLKGR